MLLMFADVLPVELDIGVLRFDLAKHFRFERGASNPHAPGRSKDVEYARTLTMSLAIEVHQIGSLITTLVTNHTQEGHRALLALLRP